jgi:hypothetical protein
MDALTTPFAANRLYRHGQDEAVDHSKEYVRDGLNLNPIGVQR